MSVVGLGVVGAGRIGGIHAVNLASGKVDAELVGIADCDQAAARALARECDAAAFSSVDELIERAGPSGLLICTPAATHLAIVEQAASASVDVFCEKPLATSLRDAEQAVRSCRDAGVLLQIGFQMRFDPTLKEIRRRVAEGDLGRPYLFRSSLRDFQPPPTEVLASSGGLLVDGAIHTLDLARWLVGEIDELAGLGARASSAIFAELGDYDSTALVARFESGCLGLFDNSRVSGYGFDAGLELVGSKATVRAVERSRAPVDWIEAGRVADGYSHDFAERFAIAYVDELGHFAHCVQTREQPSPGGEDALAAGRLAHAAAVAIREHRAVRLTSRLA